VADLIDMLTKLAMVGGAAVAGFIGRSIFWRLMGRG
jgi:hypothetical protein